MLTAIAIDDEPVALEILQHHAKKIAFLQLKAQFLSAAEGLTYLKDNPVDIVFLDISMPGLSGLEMAAYIKDSAQIVFTTAHAEHALQGFELAATDYLLKPINFARFLQACELAQRRTHQEDAARTKPETIFIKDGHSWIGIKLDDLLYARGEDNYVSLVTTEKRILTRMTLTELQQKLSPSYFSRIHKSYIISLQKVSKIEKAKVYIGDKIIPITLISPDELLQRLRQ